MAWPAECRLFLLWANIGGDTGVSAENTLMVGDRPEDEQSAQAAGVAFMWAKDFFHDEQGE